jgi:hypothetical protein
VTAFPSSIENYQLVGSAGVVCRKDQYLPEINRLRIYKADLNHQKPQLKKAVKLIISTGSAGVIEIQLHRPCSAALINDAIAVVCCPNPLYEALALFYRRRVMGHVVMGHVEPVK